MYKKISNKLHTQVLNQNSVPKTTKLKISKDGKIATLQGIPIPAERV